jgi:hypothetical protein
MATIQRIFPRLTTNALSFVRRPAGALGIWDQVSSVYSGGGARYVGPTEGASQQQAVPRFNAIGTATKSLMITQFLSDPLRKQVIPAGIWNVGFAAQLANAGMSYTWTGKAALFVMSGLTGLRSETIFDTTTIGATGRSSTAERTCFDSIAGAQVQVFTGDCLCLELGIAVTNGGAATVPVASIFADGQTPITGDNLATTDAATVLEAPVQLLLSLPQAGEQPNPSVTFKDAVLIVKEAWPPYSGRLYDWDNSEAIVARLFDAYGDIIKLYGFDQTDRLFRELNPLTTVELLPAWESLLGITLSDNALMNKTADARRQTVLGRLREMGPLTDYALAAIFSQLAGYVPPVTPEVIYQTPGELALANFYKDPLGGAIPTGSGFDNTNLIRVTTTLLDGGKVWDAGAAIFLFLSAAQSDAVHVQLTCPSGVSVSWQGGPSLSNAIVLRSPAFAGQPIHGNWKLSLYRDVGSPSVSLTNWWLYVLGKGFGGRASSRFNWAVYLDPAHQTADWRDIQGTLDRVNFSYTEGFCVYSKNNLPGANTTRAGRFLPGA